MIQIDSFKLKTFALGFMLLCSLLSALCSSLSVRTRKTK